MECRIKQGVIWSENHYMLHCIAMGIFAKYMYWDILYYFHNQWVIIWVCAWHSVLSTSRKGLEHQFPDLEVWGIWYTGKYTQFQVSPNWGCST